jgi:phage protein U
MTEGKALFALGAFRFLAGRSMFERLTRGESFIWTEQERLGGISTLSYMGRRAHEVEVTGEAYVERASTDDPLKPLKDEARRGEPLLLIDSEGRSLGSWAVLSCSEELSSFRGDGKARKVAFRLSLRRVTVDDLASPAKAL